MSFSSSPREAVANLDPLLQPFEDVNDDGIHFERHASLFYIPASVIDASNEGPSDSDKPSSPFKKCLSYAERFSGILYAFIASLLFTCSNFVIQQLNVVLFDVFLVRFLIQGIISLAYIGYKGYHPFATTRNTLLIFTRSIIAAIGSVCFYFGLDLLPLPDLITIRYTQVVWTTLLALIIFRERVTWSTIIASISTLLGVICVAQPSFLFTSSSVSNETSQTPPTTENSRSHVLGMSVAIVCAVSIALSIVLTKKLIEHQVRQSIIMFHFILTTFLLLLIIQIYYWGFSRTNQRKFNIRTIYLTKNFILATILATLQLIPMILTQKSIKREHPSIVTVVQATDILFALILKNIFLAEKSNFLALIGSTLVLTSICIIGGHKLWLDRRNRLRLPVLIEENK